MPHYEPSIRRSRTLRWFGPVALALVLLVLLGSAWITYRNLRRAAAAAEAVSHTRTVLATIEGILADLSEAESAGRGYLLSSDPVYRTQFDDAIDKVLARHADLESLTVDNPEQQARVTRLSNLIQPKIDLMRTFVSFRDAPQPDSVQEVLLLNAETQEMAAIRALIREIRQAEDEQLADRIARRERQWGQTRLMLMASTIVGCGLVLATYFLLRRHWSMQRRSAAERHKQSQKIVALARYNERLLESTGEGIYGIDKRGTCTFMNRAGAIVLGGQPEDFLGQSMHELVHHTRADGETYPLDDCPIYRATTTGDGCRVDDEVFWRLDGKPVPVEYSSFPLLEDNQVDGAVVTFTDITGRLRSQQELQMAKDAAEIANESKTQFLANMSHELRTPLNAVIMYSELLCEEAEDLNQPDFIPDLKRIRAAGKHLLELVNGLLDLSKIEAGKMELFLEPFEVRKLVDEVTATIEPMVEKNDNRLQVQLDPDIQIIHGDATKLRQVLFNLLSNACKFTEQGTITLELARDEPTSTLVFRVRDTGIGMTEQQMDRLFQPFMQADASTSRKYGGTGLGLAIIRRFTELMNGRVDVDSVLDQGTTFTVRIPEIPLAQGSPEDASGQAGAAGERAAAASITSSDHTNANAMKADDAPAGTATTATAAAGANQPDAKDPSSGSAVKTVLVIDDDAAVRDILSRVLIAEGIRPLTAADGEEGLQRAREHQPDLILLDLMMPKVDGWAVLSTLKSDPQLCHTPVILQSIRDDRDLGYMLGAAEYVVKPLDRGKLVELLRRYIGEGEGTVLVVDDDEATRRALHKTLAAEGWEVVEAEHGRHGLDAVRLRPPSVILLDLMMPEMDGFDFLHSLQEHPPWRDIPVIVLTSKDLSPEEHQRLTGGVERVIEKGSLSRHQVLDEVRRLVNSLTGRTARPGAESTSCQNGQERASSPQPEQTPQPGTSESGTGHA